MLGRMTAVHVPRIKTMSSGSRKKAHPICGKDIWLQLGKTGAMFDRTLKNSARA